MPLLKKKTLEKKPLPELLRDDEEVFHCEMTNEIFRDYEEFAERTILCNSMVWTCCMTGKSNLTYLEALHSEENARQSLRDFPVEMRIPVLFLASKTKRTSFGDMAEDVFSYIKERYFVGENVEASFSGVKWGEYHVLQVIMPNEADYKTAPKNNGFSGQPFPPAHMYKYDLEQLDADDDDVIEKMIVDFTQMRRKKGTFTKEKCKLFLKQYVEQTPEGIWGIKESAMENFGVNNCQFDQIFAGPLPDFDNVKKVAKAVNGKKVRQETLAKFLRDADGKELKINAFEDARKKQEEKQRSKEEQKLKTAEEKQKRKEENIKFAHLFKEWYRPKEDLELEDQKKLPNLPVVKTKVPNKYMGEVFMVVEFVKSFSKILRTKDFFPGGFTVDVMERALMEKEVAGPLIDLFQMLLSALFAQHEEEVSQIKIIPENYGELKILPENPSLNECVRFATSAVKFAEKYQGVPLNQLPMYSLTVTEILRLHLLSSGARINESGARWRYQQRGGYTNEDDPGLYLRQHQPHLLKLLAVHNLVELTVGQKLELVSCLISQLLTFADVRDEIDERIEAVRQKKVDIKNAQIAERKRCADVVTAKTKVRANAELTKEQISAELAKITLANERHHAEYERKMKKLSNNSSDHQVSLGYDRAFRRYVKLDSVPGLFIDPYEENTGVCLKNPVRQLPELIDASRDALREHLLKTHEVMNSSDKENNPEKTPKINGTTNGSAESHQDDSNLFLCTGDKSDCLVHSTSRCDAPWQYVSNVEELDELINSLNKRGIRESELAQALQANYYKLEQCVPETTQNLLNVDERTEKPVKRARNRYEDCNFGFPSDADPVEVCRSTLVENILEMEEKIFAGNLGSLKIKDRNHWRKCLAEGKFLDLDKTLVGRPIENGKVNSIKEEHESRSSRESTPDVKTHKFKDPGTTLGCTSTTMEVDGEDVEEDIEIGLSEDQKNALHCLSIALAQVAHSVDSRYLKKPLGKGRPDSKKGHDTSPKDVLHNWEQSLLASTSYSQVFLHYGTLDGCILWSRSVLLARCRTCRRQRDSENMLLCDHCNFGYHLYCLKPKLYSIPKGEWFCPKCLDEKEKEQKLLNPEPEPVKRKRRIFRDEDIDEEEEEDGDGESGDEGEKGDHAENGHESGDEDNDMEAERNDLCVMCGSGGELLSCEKCPNIYHIECIEPPLRRMPRGPWTCNCCKEKKRSEERRSHRDNDSDSSAEVSHATRRSNRREAEDLPLHNVALQDLLAEVMRHKDAWPFLRPVQKNEVPDYYEVIAKPMDFGTIKYKLNMGKYMCDQELMSDAVLVFENCNTYNDTDADVYKCGVRLLKVFQKKAKELSLKVPEEMQEEDDDDVKPSKNKKRRTK